MPNSGAPGFGWALVVVVVVVATIASSIVASSAAAISPHGPMTMPGIPPGAMEHMEHPTKAAWIPYLPALHPRGWTIFASSAAAGHPARAVLGSRQSAYWQSARLGQQAQLPQSITITFPSAELVSGLTYVPRSGLGEIGRFRVTLSRDGRRFGPTVAYGRWQANATDKKVAWMPRVVRAVRLTAVSVSPVRARSLATARIVLTGARQGATARASNVPAGPSAVGQWGPTIGFPLVPVAAALIPGNKLLVWSADEDLSFGSGTSPYTQTAILDLTTGTVSAATISNTADNMFCPGVSILPNGDVMVTGGISDVLTSIYNPATNTWSAGPQMNIGRGYQGQTTLADGQVFVLGGSWSGATGGKLGEVWSSTGDWRELTNVPANPIYTADAAGVYRADNHGWFIATSGGKVFHAGPSAQMHWITTTGAGSITSAGNRGNAGDQMNGNAVLYDVGKILTAGGAPSYQDSNATATASIVDISTGTAQVKSTSPMNYQRAFANSVALPTGQVFTVGGQSYALTFSDQNSDTSPEMWNPSDGTWTAMASQPEPRNYHSVAVLLPDGTVFSGGGGMCGSCATNHPDGQIFYPPYLFNPDGSRRIRPTISSAPSTAITGQTISVTTGGPVQSFVLMRYDEATHALDNDQRRLPLTITSSSGNTYQLTIPSDPGVALPGPYMLFAIDAQGTPSVSATIVVSTPALSVPSTSYGKTVDSTGPAVYWPLADSNGSTGSADLSGNRDTGAFSTSGITYQTPSPIEGSSGQGVTLNGGQIISTQPQATPTSYSEELWFKTTSTSGGVLTRFGDSPTGADASNDRVLYMTSSGQLYFGTWTGVNNMVTSPRPYNDGNWHFAVITQGSDGMHMYVDGAQVASSSITGTDSYMGYWQLGGTVTAGWPNQPSGAFSGSISDAAMYRTELTPGQIQAQYLASPTTRVKVSMSPGSVIANGAPTSTATSSATATVTDADGNPVDGDQVSFTSSDPGDTIGPVTDNGNGTYTATITSSPVVGQVTITATDSSVSPSIAGHATLGQTAGQSVIAVDGSDNSLHVQTPGQGWQNLGGYILAAPAVAALPTTTTSGNESPLFVAVGGDHNLWVRSLTAGWSKLASAYCLDNPAAMVTGSTLYVACQGSDHGLWYGKTTLTSGPPSVSAMYPLGGGLSAGPAIATVAGTPTFLVSGTDHQLWIRTLSTGYSGYRLTCNGHPAAGVAPRGSTTYVACDGSGGALYVWTSSGAGWHSTGSANGSYGGVISDGPGISVTTAGPFFWGAAGSGLCITAAPNGWSSYAGITGVQHGAGAVGIG